MDILTVGFFGKYFSYISGPARCVLGVQWGENRIVTKGPIAFAYSALSSLDDNFSVPQYL